MIKKIEARLIKWGEFIQSGRGSGGGLPFPAYRLVHVQGGEVATVLVDSDVLETDGAMARIKLSKPGLYEVAYGLYVSGISALSVAGRVRCHVDTVYARRDALHRLVERLIAERRGVACRNAA